MQPDPRDIQWSVVWDAHDAQRESNKGCGLFGADLGPLLTMAIALVRADMKKEPDDA